MQDLPKILLITTQTWLQVTRLAMRFMSRGCRLSVICPEESSLCHAPCFAVRFRFQLLDPFGSLRHAIETSEAEYLLPCDDPSVWFLHELAERVPAMQPLIERSLGSARSFPLLRSRMQLLTLAHELGIRVPLTERITDIYRLGSWCSRPGGFVLKKDGTWGGSGVQIIQAVNSEQRNAQTHIAYHRLLNGTAGSARLVHWLRNGDGSAFARLRCMGLPEITAQACVEGSPATSMYACHQGRILGEVQARVLVSRGRTGPSMVIRSIRDARISHAGALLASRLRLSGFFGLDFMLDSRSGEPFLVELNPRATQLTPLAVAGQVDLVSLMWAHWSGKSAPAPHAASLGRTVCFYPEGRQWIEQTGNYPECRTDLSPNEQAAINTVIQRSYSRKSNLRNFMWKSLSRFKNSFGVNTVPEPFRHEASGVRPRSEEARACVSDDVAAVSV